MKTPGSHFLGLCWSFAVPHRAQTRLAFASVFLAGIFSMALGRAAPDCAPQPSGLVAWWRAEGNTDDACGTNHGASPYGIAYGAGVVGEAFDFNATSRRVSVPDADAIKLTRSMTIEGWVFLRSYGGFILFRGDTRTGLDPYALVAGSDGYVHFHLESDSQLINLQAPFPVNQWKHLAATLDDATGDMRIYVDGVLAAQTNTTVRPLRDLDPAHGAGLGIGNHSGTGHNFALNGLVDEIALYDRALSAAEIQAICTAGGAGKCPVIQPPTVPWIAGPITNAANGHWYYLLSPTNWAAAEAIAVSLGGHLATINNAAENQWVFDNFSSFGVVERTLWLGLNDAGQEYIWFWASGQPVTYVNWAPGEPNNGGGYFPNEDHTLMWNPSSGYPAGSWNDSPEDQLHCAVVEVSPPEPVIVAGPITNSANGHAYYLLTYTNWPAAEQIAVGLGGHLATINDAAENDWIFNTFANYGGLERPMWIGLNDAAQEGTWVWVNGEPATYRNWSPIEPNSGNGVFPDEDHVMMWHPSSGYPLGSWNDGPSNQLQYAVVEVLTAEQAAERLAQAVRDGVENSQPLLASLNAAIASMDRGNPTAAINQLQAFQNKVAAQVAPLNPELADLFIRLAQEVIDALNGGVPAGTPPVKIHKATRQADGKFKVHATGAAGRIHIVEASTDLVTWERIGVARRNAAGEFEFEDSRASQFNGRFYRIATP